MRIAEAGIGVTAQLEEVVFETEIGQVLRIMLALHGFVYLSNQSL
jgi:hypothetical protein